MAGSFFSLGNDYREVKRRLGKGVLRKELRRGFTPITQIRTEDLGCKDHVLNLRRYCFNLRHPRFSAANSCFWTIQDRSDY